MKIEIELREGFNPEDYDSLKKVLDNFMNGIFMAGNYWPADADQASFLINVSRHNGGIKGEERSVKL